MRNLYSRGKFPVSVTVILLLATMALFGALNEAKADKVYTVTNLNNEGAGSFRNAVEQSNVDGMPSRIVFAVGGTIVNGYLPTGRADARHHLREGNLIIDGLKNKDTYGWITLDGNNFADMCFRIGSDGNIICGLTVTNYKTIGVTTYPRSDDNIVDSCTFYYFPGNEQGITFTSVFDTVGSRNNIAVNNWVEDCAQFDGRGILVSWHSSAVVVGNVVIDNYRGVMADYSDSFMDFRANYVVGNNYHYGAGCNAGVANFIDNYIHDNTGFELNIIDGADFYRDNNDISPPGDIWITTDCTEYFSVIEVSDTPYPSWLASYPCPDGNAPADGGPGAGGTRGLSLPAYDETLYPSVSIIAVPESAHVGEEVQFYGICDPGYEDEHTYEWNFGDGSSASNERHPVHSFPGDATVTFMVTDGGGRTAGAEMVIKITDENSPLVQTLRPTADGDSNEFQFVYPYLVTGRYQAVDEVVSDNWGSYLSSGKLQDLWADPIVELYQMEDTDQMAGASVSSLTEHMVWKKKGGVAYKLGLELKSGGTEIRQGPYSGGNLFADTNYTWATNPSTTSPWTPPEVDAIQAGTYGLTDKQGEIYWGGWVSQVYLEAAYSYSENAPTADAGTDQSAVEQTAVTLDGSGSSDPNSDPLTYSWAQLVGPAVTLSSAGTVSPTFTAPDVDSPTILGFKLMVNDGTYDGPPDAVNVTVNPRHNIIVDFCACYPYWYGTDCQMEYQVRSPGLPPTEPIYEDELTVSISTGDPAAGSLTIPNIPDGTYDVALKHCNHIADMATNVIVAGADVTGFDLSLWAGDADGDDDTSTVYPEDPKGDNDVDFYDYYILYYQYLGSLPVTAGRNADFDGDGDIDFYDYNGLYYGYLNNPDPGNWFFDFL